jgi:hypothetical protein
LRMKEVGYLHEIVDQVGADRGLLR